MTAFAGRGRRLSGGLAAALSAGGLLAVGPADAVGAKATPVASPGVTHSDISSAAVPTTSPIKHVVVIIGENHTFDNIFATYKSDSGAYVKNLLSEGIVTASGAPGPNVAKAEQQTASDTGTYQLKPTLTGPYKTLPRPNTTYVEPGCDGQTEGTIDQRFPSGLPNAPYQITKYVPYLDPHTGYQTLGGCQFTGAYVGDPIHRFYQMNQEVSEGSHNIWTWVHQTADDANGQPAPSPFTDQTTQQGALDMGFYNMASGDVPTLNFLAQHYALSDNYHQPVMGGTGANHIALGTGYAAYYQNADGKATAPPAGEIENPNPQPGTNNFYTQDGYGKSGTTDGGSYSNCSDHSAPGVSAIFDYLDSLSYTTFHNGNCAPGHYYLLNNYNPGYNVDGTLNTSTFTVPPQHNWPTIGGKLSGHGITWGYFGEGYNHGKPTVAYCTICDPMAYSAQIMTNPALRANVDHGIGDFDNAAARGALPAVSFVKPGEDDGHPGYSTLAAFEKFATHIINEVQSNPEMWRSTAIFVTFDEGGGYYDSGYIQPVSFFGDGTRVPMIVVSPYAKSGYVSHSYTDHVSILKFIERNWGLSPLSEHSTDNLANPVSTAADPYVPVNQPAIGDLFDMFDFHSAEAASRPAPLPVARGRRTSNAVVNLSGLQR